MAKRNSLYTIVADAVGGLVTVTSGERRQVINVAELSDAMTMQAAVHGIKQKVGDAGAVEADEKTGKVDSAERIRRVFEMADRVSRGVWNERAAGGTSDDMILFRALVLAYPDKTSDQLTRYMEGLQPTGRRQLLNQKEGNRLAPFVDKVRAEIAASLPLDAEALLDTLDVE